MNSFRHQLLPVPCSTADQHVKIGARHTRSFFNCVIAGDRPIMCVSFIGSNTPDDPATCSGFPVVQLTAHYSMPRRPAKRRQAVFIAKYPNCSGVIASRVSAPMRFCPANSGRPTQAWTFRLPVRELTRRAGSGKSLSAGKTHHVPARAMASQRGCPFRAVKRSPSDVLRQPSIASGINCRDS